MRRRSPASDLSGLERGGNAVPADHACGRAVERAASRAAGRPRGAAARESL